MLANILRLAGLAIIRGRRLIISITCLCVAALATPAHATLVSTFVDSAYGTGSAPAGQYDYASVTVFIDPAQTNWIAWNNAPDVIIVNAGCSGGHCLGPGGFGTDDYIQITVTAPGGGSSSVAYDQNNAYGNSTGQQNVIFGTAAAAPDAIRTSPSFGSPPNVTTIFDEAGAQNSIFTTAGNYLFEFSWRNLYTGGAGHPDTYLLRDVVENNGAPEPETALLVGLALLGLAMTRRTVG